MIKRVATVATVLIALVLCLPASADPFDDFDALFPPGKPSCFARFYDADHMQAHPQQTVTSLRLVRSYPGLLYEDDIDKPPPREDRRAKIEVIATFRDSGKTSKLKRFAGGAGCYVNVDTIHCASDTCNGGGFTVVREPEGTILIKLQDNGWFSLRGSCGGDDDRSLARGADDRTFRLAPGPQVACR
jgi:hypothetical protein